MFIIHKYTKVQLEGPMLIIFALIICLSFFFVFFVFTKLHFVLGLQHQNQVTLKHTHNPMWMKTNHMNRKLKKFRISYYLQPLVFDLLYSLFYCKF